MGSYPHNNGNIYLRAIQYMVNEWLFEYTGFILINW